MELKKLALPSYFFQKYSGFTTLTPIQEKAIAAGLLENKSMLICAPTASGKTLVATMAIVNTLSNGAVNTLSKGAVNTLSKGTINALGEDASEKIRKGKALYIVPLKALAKEKFNEYQSLLEGTSYTVMVATGDVDSDSTYLNNYDLIVLTSEKLDSLLRHKIGWLGEVKLIVIDEIHLLNDPTRGPALEVIITLLKQLINPQIIGLSATIGNKKALADWLEAVLVEDDWRPVELKKGIYSNGKTEFY